MSEAVQIAFVNNLPGILAAVFSFAALLMAARTKAIALKTEQNTNHMKDELVALTAKSSHAEGKLEGQKEAKENGN